VAEQTTSTETRRGAAPVRKGALAHVQLLDAREVAALLSISVPTLWRCVKQERVPKPMHMGPRLVRWRLRDLERFVGADGDCGRASGTGPGQSGLPDSGVQHRNV
jgi:predicted DNA-binding transcriptional regulator AlpA